MSYVIHYTLCSACRCTNHSMCDSLDRLCDMIYLRWHLLTMIQQILCCSTCWVSKPDIIYCICCVIDHESGTNACVGIWFIICHMPYIVYYPLIATHCLFYIIQHARCTAHHVGCVLYGMMYMAPCGLCIVRYMLH